MNIQELKDQVSSLPSLFWWQDHGAKVMIAKDIVLGLIDQLDEPQKVVIPKLVAEWIEECKAKNYGIGECLTNAIEYAMPEEVIAWFDSDKETEKDKELLIARAYLDGYEIEQEKLYTVEIPDPNSAWNYTYLGKNNNGYISIYNSNFSNWISSRYNQLTESEIRKDFDWAWKAGFAKEVE